MKINTRFRIPSRSRAEINAKPCEVMPYWRDGRIMTYPWPPCCNFLPGRFLGNVYNKSTSRWKVGNQVALLTFYFFQHLTLSNTISICCLWNPMESILIDFNFVFISGSPQCTNTRNWNLLCYNKTWRYFWRFNS